MITFLSTQTIDLDGSIMIDALPDSDFGETRRRATRIQTTDGGAVVADYGFSYSDRNFRIVWFSREKEYEDKIDRLISTYAKLLFSCHLGIFKVVPSGYRIQNGQSEINLLVLDKL